MSPLLTQELRPKVGIRGFQEMRTQRKEKLSHTIVQLKQVFVPCEAGGGVRISPPLTSGTGGVAEGHHIHLCFLVDSLPEKPSAASAFGLTLLSSTGVGKKGCPDLSQTEVLVSLGLACGFNTLLREPWVSSAGKTHDQSRADCVRASKVFEKVRYRRDHF